MPQVVVPSPCLRRNGHLKRISQQAPQRLQSPRRSASLAITSSRRKLLLTKRRSLPCAWRARKRASSTARRRFAAASLSSKARRAESVVARRPARLCVVGFIAASALGSGAPGLARAGRRFFVEDQ